MNTEITKLNGVGARRGWIFYDAACVACVRGRGRARACVAARVTDAWPETSVFGNLDEASAFFRNGGCGWSPVNGCSLEGVELHVEDWSMRVLEVEHVESSYFSDPKRFPHGFVSFDCALLLFLKCHE